MTGRSQSLLERWDQYMADGGVGPRNDEIRRAIAIAQAVDEWKDGMGKRLQSIAVESIFIRADELLK